MPNLLNTFLLSSLKSFRAYSKTRHSNLNSLLFAMPKEHRHVADAQKQRRKIKEKSTKYVPGRVTLQVLGTGAEGAPRSLYVFSDQTRYMFNCGEGTQRLAHEHKMKLAKLENVFITQPVWCNIGGLPGTALTMQDVGVPEVTLHGPKGLDKLFVATKRFVVMKDLLLKMADGSETFEDNVMTVQYVPLTRNTNEGNSAEEKEPQSLEMLEEESAMSESDKSTQNSQCVEMLDCGTSTRSERKRRNRNRTPASSRNSSVSTEEDDTDYYAHESKSKKRRGRRRSRSRSQSASGFRSIPETISPDTRRLLTAIKAAGVTMSYICRLQPRPGALCVEKCARSRVPPGPLLGRLKAGEDVTLEGGRVVRASDVCEPDDPGPVFIVMDCPSEEYLDSVLNNGLFKVHQSTATRDEDIANVVVHFSPKNIINNSRYKAWIDGFSPSTQHMFINDMNSCMGSISVHRVQYKLNLLHTGIFPILGDCGTEILTSQDCQDSPACKRLKPDEDSPTKNSVTTQINQLNVTGEFRKINTFCNFHLRPRKGFDSSEEIKLVPSEYIDETMQLEEFPVVLKELQASLKQSSLKKQIREYPKLVFLGTGSCIPNKTRNTSGILLQTSAKNNILIDCGEGTYGQIVRFFGGEKAREVLSNINAIYVSHLHADHHIGLNGLLLGRRKSLKTLQQEKPPVLLFAPRQISHWLNFYDSCFEDIKQEFILVSNTDMMLNQNILCEDIQKLIRNSLEMSEINTCYVKHCPNAFGVSFIHENGYKITYSGDTMPCDDLVDLGMNSDILIHEATMEDELAREAIVKMHSTTSQAIEIGVKMKAKYTLLTHFSQRYAKLPRFNENFSEKIGIAFDNMQVRLDELPLLPLLNPALKLMFAEHTEEMENKAVKRQLRIEREQMYRERQQSQSNDTQKVV